MTPQELKDHPRFGSFAAIARACGVSRNATRKWQAIPVEHCKALALFSGGDLTRAQLRPDVFGGVSDRGLKKTT